MILSAVPDERAEMALKEARRLGYRSVFCSDTVHAPTASLADISYTADWEDFSAVLEIAEKENIDGVVPLCDKACLSASVVAEKLNLPGNSSESVRSFLSKNAFRDLQEKAGVFTPRHLIAASAEEAAFCREFRFPIIVKPLLSSSSFGMTVLENADGLLPAFEKASKQSRNGEVCIEEYIRNDTLRIIEADVFLLMGEILWDGVRYCYRLEQAPLRPVYDVYPVVMTEEETKEFRQAVSSVIDASGASIGEFNVEGFFTEEGRFFIVEINPRQAGHYNPQDIELYCGVNLTRLLVTSSCRDLCYYNELRTFHRSRNHVLSYSVFSFRSGILHHIHIDPSIRPFLKAYRFLHGQKEGDRVKDIHQAVRPIVKAVFQFDSAEDLETARSHITELVYPVLEETNEI